MLKLKRNWILVLLPISFIILMIVKRFPAVAEYVFARGIYKLVGTIIAFFTNWLPFSLAEIGIILIPFLVLAILIIFIKKIISSKGRRKLILIKGVINTACLGTLIFFFLTVMCLVNIHRFSFASVRGLEVKQSGVLELYDMTLDLAQKTNDAKEHVSTDDLGAMVSELSFKEIAKEAARAFETLSQTYPTLGAIKGTAKPIFFSRAMSYTGIIGVYVPFTMESNVDTDISDYSIPETMCHELAHLQGYMKEDEANYIGYLACMHSDNNEFKYSGYMMALVTSMNALYDSDPDLYVEVYEKLSDKVKADFKANREYWKEIEETELGQKVEQAADSFNDSYLKFSGQEEGIKTYGLVVDLLLAEYRKGAQ